MLRSLIERHLQNNLQTFIFFIKASHKFLQLPNVNWSIPYPILCANQCLNGKWRQCTLKGSNIHPLVLKADSEVTVKIAIANTSRAIAAMIGYLGALIFHNLKHQSLLLLLHTHPTNTYPPPIYIPNHSLPQGVGK
jgi:hypothetical protein